MNKTILLVGATGDLGGRVLRYLHEDGARVRCLVRRGSAAQAKAALGRYAAEVVEVDFDRTEDIAQACRGGSVLVSTVSGLDDVVVDLQTRLLDGAVRAGVPRFIPSDFAIDYRQLRPEDNRNLALRERFRQVLDSAPIRATSILNGAFTDMLTGVAPFVLFRIRRILCWGNPEQVMDWTTIDDTARYTAKAAQDDDTPRYLFIAGDQFSARDLSDTMTEITGQRHQVLVAGGFSLFKALIGITRIFVPGKRETYPPWQGMQYMLNLYQGDAKFARLDNDRYPMKWTTARDVLGDYLSRPDAVAYRLK